MTFIWIIITLLLSTINQTLSIFEPCLGNVCPPTGIKPKLSTLNPQDGFAPIFLGRDENSDCYCRERPRKFVVCFGRESCNYFPIIFNITTPELRIKSTQIIELKSGDFQKIPHLEKLLIEGNRKLTTIRSGTFSNMTNLRNMSISFNLNLKKLEPGSFDGLINLEELFLVKNAFNNILDVAPALSPKYLPKLQKLSLTENNFAEIHENDLSLMFNNSIRELNLILCQIEYIHPKSFKGFGKLNVLRIGENFFNVTTLTELIEKMIEFQIPLQSLNLYSVGLRRKFPMKLLKVISKSNITNLSLSRNHFELIDSFPLMPNLKLLDLREVSATSLTRDAFVNLTNLKTLLLSGNKLASLPEDLILTNLTYLDLQDNSGNSFSPSYLTLSNNKFTKMSNLEWLNLCYNRITELHNSTFVGLENLKVLGLKNATIYELDNNTFSMLKNLIFLNLENNYFIKINPRGIDKDIFNGLDNLQILLLGGNEIKFISRFINPFNHLKSLIHLGLENNKLLTLNPTDFHPLIKLEQIDLSGNLLKPWQERIFIENQNLKEFRAKFNKFNYLTDAMLQDFVNLTILELNDNPFTCDCSIQLYYQNIDNNTFTIINQTTFCTFPESTINKTIGEFLLENLCESESLNLLILLPLIILLATLLILCILLYYYRWHVRYWIFLTRLYLSRHGKYKKPKRSEKSTTGYVNYVYDAFVSYSNEDRNFVIRLVTMLENYDPFLKLCVYERDFQIGTIISESVLESVAKSRRTLLIISDSYAKSQWCRWESQIAEHHRLFFENSNGEYVDDSLVLIKLGPVSENHLTPTLKYLLKTRIYLQWDPSDNKQKVFWEKLRNTLAPPAGSKIVENTHM